MIGFNRESPSFGQNFQKSIVKSDEFYERNRSFIKCPSFLQKINGQPIDASRVNKRGGQNFGFFTNHTFQQLSVNIPRIVFLPESLKQA